MRAMKRTAIAVDDAIGGFDRQRVDADFLLDTQWRSSFLLNIGYGDSGGLHPRNPRLSFEEACLIE